MKAQEITKAAVVVDEDTTLQEALTRMNTEHTNTLLVVGENGVLTGEVSVSDLLDAVLPDTLTGDEVIEHFTDEATFITSVQAAADRPVHEFMVRDFTSVTADDGLITIAANAIGYQRARIPVVDKEGRPIGIISRQGLKQILAQYLEQ